MPFSTTMRFRQLGREWLLRFVASSLWKRLKNGIPLGAKQAVLSRLARSIRNDFRFTRTHEWTIAPAMAGDGSTACSALSSGTPVGVNLYGYLSKWMGLGECARLFAQAMIVGGFPVALRDVKISAPRGEHDHTLDLHLGHPAAFDHDLVFVNPDYWHELPEKRSRARYVIAYWFWELEKFPPQWQALLDDVDEVMVGTAFVEQAIRRVTDKPVTKIPLPISLAPDSGLQRHHFGLPEEDFVFLTMFDFNSSIARKNPIATIEAFRLAFPRGDEKARLLLKSSNGHHYPPQLMHLIAAAAGDSRIMIRDDLLERADLQALQRCCNAYVSLHRCEGFGLVMAETMLMGKPVIATGYSGNLEFMNADNSCLVDYELTRVQTGEYPLAEGQHWASPNVHHAAQHMQTLFADPEFSHRLGARAAADMSVHYSPTLSLRKLQDRLRAIASRHQVEAGDICDQPLPAEQSIRGQLSAFENQIQAISEPNQA